MLATYFDILEPRPTAEFGWSQGPEQIFLLTHELPTDAAGEVASVELPGEFWAMLTEAGCAGLEIFTRPLHELLDQGELLPVARPMICVRSFLNAKRDHGDHAVLVMLRPYVALALEMGYEHLLLAS